jgi:hypothetical protein
MTRAADATSVRARIFGSSGAMLLCALVVAKLLLHLAFSHNYSFFRDELYFMACGEHLAWGYVDQPPLVAVAARLSRTFLGDSVFALRFLPAVAGAAIVFLTGWLAREFGGGRFAQLLAALAIFFAPAYLAFDSYLSMNAFEPVFWMICAYLLIRILKGDDPRLWLLFGIVAGIGLLNKYTVFVFGFAVATGLLLTPSRAQFRSKWIWLAGAIAVAIVLSSLIWQAQHHWPQIETVRNAQQFKNSPISPLRFLLEQILFLHPVALPIWLAGLAWFFTSEEGKRFRCLGWAFLVVFGVFLLLKGKTYYVLPAYPMIVAAGGVAIERWVREFSGKSTRKWLVTAYSSLLILAGVATLPFGVPMLPVETFLRYSDILPFARPVKMERDATGPLPQLFADMFGWENMVATVASVYQSLPPDERTRCAILAGNYGEAGAIDFFGRKYGLPKAIGGHNNYYLWGSRDYTGEVVILFGDRAETLKTLFGEVEQVATISNPYAMPNENNVPVYICRRPRAPLAELWPRFKYYI